MRGFRGTNLELIWPLRVELSLARCQCRCGARGLFLQRQNEKQTNPDTNGAVRHIEGREANFTAATLIHIKLKAINHVMPGNPVEQIPQNSTKEQSERDLAARGARIEVLARCVEHQQCGERDKRQYAVVLAKETPRCSSVIPVHELEKTIDHDSFLGISGKFQDDQFGQLIDNQHYERNECHLLVCSQTHE